MKQLNQDIFVDVNAELKDMIEYTLTIWDGNSEDLTHIVNEAFMSGYNTANNWISDYKLTDYLISWLEKREKLASKTDIMLYDDVTKIAKNVMFHASTLKQLILEDFSYEKTARALTSSIKTQLSDSKVFPKNWQQLINSKKSAFESFDYFNLSEDNYFKGHNSDTSGAPGFHERINLANTYYGDSEQGRSPLYTLVSSAFAHGLTIREHNNGVELQKDLKNLQDYFNQEQFNKPVFIKDLLSLSHNKIFQALMIDKYSLSETREYNSQEQLDQHIKNQHINKDIYGMVKWSMLGSDDYRHTGFTIQKIYNLEHFEKQIKENVENWFEDNYYKEIYYSDNNFTTVGKAEILSSLKFSEISKNDFDSFKNVLGGKEQVRFGDYEDFMDYAYPTKKEITAFNANRMNDIVSSLNSENNDPKEILAQTEREENYKKQVFSILGIKLKNKNKLK